MSYLNSYRIHFFGGIETNPSTMNNRYDENGEIIFDPVKAILAPKYQRPSSAAEDLVNELKLTTYSQDKNLLSGWNYFGGHSFEFEEVGVSSFGHPNDIQHKGGIVGAKVELLGTPFTNQGNQRSIFPVLVDVDPTGIAVSQVFAGGFLIKKDGQTLLEIHDSQVIYNRGSGQHALSRKNNHGGFTQFATFFQVSFAYSDHWIYDPDSPEISELVRQAKAQAGITVCFSMFEALTEFDNQELRKKYEANEDPANPVLAYTIGTIGVWHKEDLKTCLPGRLLIQDPPAPFPFQRVCYASMDEPKGLLSLQMANSFEKPDVRTDRDDLSEISATDAPSSLSLAIDNDGHIELIAAIPYNNANYHLTGGVVDLSLSREQLIKLKGRPILIVDTSQPSSPLFREQEYRILSDSRGEYLDHGSHTDHTFQITRFGEPVTTEMELSVTLETGGKLLKISKDYGKQTIVVLNSKDEEVHFTGTNGKFKGNIRVYPDNTGRIRLLTEWKNAGIQQLSFLYEGKQLYYAEFRVYPNDDYSNLSDTEKFKWDFIYREILSYYRIIYPDMSTFIPLNEEKIILLTGVQMINVLSKEHSNGALMPVTRDMSSGKRDLLIEFIERNSSTGSNTIS